MVSNSKEIKKILLALHEAIKEGKATIVSESLEKINIDQPITSTGMTAFAFACSQT